MVKFRSFLISEGQTEIFRYLDAIHPEIMNWVELLIDNTQNVLVYVLREKDGLVPSMYEVQNSKYMQVVQEPAPHVVTADVLLQTISIMIS